MKLRGNTYGDATACTVASATKSPTVVTCDVIKSLENRLEACEQSQRHFVENLRSSPRAVHRQRQKNEALSSDGVHSCSPPGNNLAASLTSKIVKTPRKKVLPTSTTTSQVQTPPPGDDEDSMETVGKKLRHKLEVKIMTSKNKRCEGGSSNSAKFFVETPKTTKTNKRRECRLRRPLAASGRVAGCREGEDGGRLETICEFEFSHKILVSNIPLGMSVSNLQALFSKWGQCQIEVTSVSPDLSSQWAIVCYSSDRERKLAYYQNWSVLKPQHLTLDLLDPTYKKLEDSLLDKKKSAPSKYPSVKIFDLGCLLTLILFIVFAFISAGLDTEENFDDPSQRSAVPKMETENGVQKVDLQNSQNDDPTLPPIEPQFSAPYLYGPKFDKFRPANCLEIQMTQNLTTLSEKMTNPATSSFQIYPFTDTSQAIEVACDFETEGGGWTIIQRRGSGGPKTQFWRTWTEYEAGFGEVKENGNFWLGLSAMAALTHRHGNELLVTLKDWEGQKKWASYENFFVSGPAHQYTLSVGGYHGDAGDSLAYHNGQKFSTHDLDNDAWRGNCAADGGGGGWWFRGCQESNLNGRYAGAEENSLEGVQWQSWRGLLYSLKETEMKIRPRWKSQIL